MLLSCQRTHNAREVHTPAVHKVLGLQVAMSDSLHTRNVPAPMLEHKLPEFEIQHEQKERCSRKETAYKGDSITETSVLAKVLRSREQHICVLEHHP